MLTDAPALLSGSLPQPQGHPNRAHVGTHSQNTHPPCCFPWLRQGRECSGDLASIFTAAATTTDAESSYLQPPAVWRHKQSFWSNYQLTPLEEFMDESSLANYFNYFLTQSPGLSAAAHSTAWQLPAPYVPPFPEHPVPENPSSGTTECMLEWMGGGEIPPSPRSRS